MKDIQLYQQILGDTTPWSVASVRLDVPAQTVEIEMALNGESLWGCPECGKAMHHHDLKRRRWRHLDSCQFKTFLVADVPRVICSEHGTQTVKVPWAEPLGRFTALFERFAIDLMLACSTSQAATLLRVSWDEADGIKQRAVQRGLARRKNEPVRRVCVDEKAVGRGQTYVTIVSSLDSGRARVVYMGDDRTESSLDGFWLGMSEKQRGSVEAVSMDMWQAYWNSTVRRVPLATDKIVHDPYHLATYMNKALDAVRRAEHAVLHHRDDSTLKGSRMLWLYGEENVPSKWVKRFQKLIANTKLKTARAWAVKELWRAFWKSPDADTATETFREWYREAMATRLEPIKKVARMFKAHLRNILTYFTLRISNGPAEAINSRIGELVAQSCGYRNRERFKNDVFFHLGGLDLYPINARSHANV
jgi:transposase